MIKRVSNYEIPCSKHRSVPIPTVISFHFLIDLRFTQNGGFVNCTRFLKVTLSKTHKRLNVKMCRTHAHTLDINLKQCLHQTIFWKNREIWSLIIDSFIHRKCMKLRIKHMLTSYIHNHIRFLGSVVFGTYRGRLKLPPATFNRK